MQKILSILASKNMSLICFFINCFLTASAYFAGDMFWCLLSFSFAMLCFYNYATTDTQ